MWKLFDKINLFFSDLLNSISSLFNKIRNRVYPKNDVVNSSQIISTLNVELPTPIIPEIQSDFIKQIMLDSEFRVDNLKINADYIQQIMLDSEFRVDNLKINADYIQQITLDSKFHVDNLIAQSDFHSFIILSELNQDPFSAISVGNSTAKHCRTYQHTSNKKTVALSYYLLLHGEENSHRKCLTILNSMTDEEIRTELNNPNISIDVKKFIQKNKIKSDLSRIFSTQDRYLCSLPIDLLKIIFHEQYEYLTLEEVKQSLVEVFTKINIHHNPANTVPVIFSNITPPNLNSDNSNTESLENTYNSIGKKI